MNIRLILLYIGILTLIITGCTPVIPPEQGLSSGGNFVETPTIQPEESNAATETPVFVVTPRGDQLVASDPKTVNLGSGTLTLVEFFRFT